jgi:CelD/BcsL family acetyltransferase involved in cellulose biosynthesis
MKAGQPMHIDVVEDSASLKRLRHDWDAVYDSDPEAHVFLSWDWFCVLRAQFDYDWLLLAVRPGQTSGYVAFCPLKRVTKRRDNGDCHDEIRMAGFPHADYTGFLCRPEYQAEAIPAIARHLRAQNWGRIALEFVRASESRMKLFLGPFADDEFAVEKTERLIKNNTINNNICPFVNLPCDWDTYLGEKLSANTRQKVKRFLRKIDDGEEFRITHADARSYERDLDMLLRFWEAQWGPKKGKRLTAMLSVTRKMLTGLFQAGMLVVPVFWKGDVPLGAIALIKDERKRWLHFQIAGRDGAFGSPPPGFILHAHSIRWAIRNGYSAYDMMRGNEPYKYLFGCEERRAWSVSIRHKIGRPLAEPLHGKTLT